MVLLIFVGGVNGESSSISLWDIRPTICTEFNFNLFFPPLPHMVAFKFIPVLVEVKLWGWSGRPPSGLLLRVVQEPGKPKITSSNALCHKLFI